MFFEIFRNSETHVPLPKANMFFSIWNQNSWSQKHHGPNEICHHDLHFCQDFQAVLPLLLELGKLGYSAREDLVDWEGFRGQNLPQTKRFLWEKWPPVFGSLTWSSSSIACCYIRVTRLHVVHIVHFTYEPAQQFRETCQTAPGRCILFPRKAMKDHGTQARFPGSIDLNLVVHMALGHVKIAGKLLFSPAKLWQNHRF